MEEELLDERAKIRLVMEAVGTGARFLWRPDARMWAMLGRYFLVVLVVTLGQALLMNVLNLQDMDQVLLLVKEVILPVPVIVWVVSQTLKGDTGLGYFSLFTSKLTWRVLWAGLLRTLIVGAPLVCVMLGLFVEFGVHASFVERVAHFFAVSSLPVPSTMQLAPLVMVWVFVLMFVSMYLLLRLAFLSAYVVDHNQMNLVKAYHGTKHLLSEIFATFLLSGVGVFLLIWMFHGVLHVTGLGDLMTKGHLITGVLIKSIDQTVMLYCGLWVSVSLADLYKKTKKPS